MLFKKIFIKFLEKRYDPSRIEKFENIKSILIRPLGYAIGDATVHTAHIKQLREIFPNALIGVIVERDNHIIFESSGLVDKYVNKNILSLLKNRKKWDLLIDFENNFTSSSLLLDRILMPKKIMIFSKKFKKSYNLNNIKAYDIYSPQEVTTPLSHYLSNSVLNQYYVIPKPQSTLHVSPKEYAYSQSFWQQNKIRILLCPQGSKRELPVTELAELLIKTGNNLQNTCDLSKEVCFLIGYTPTAPTYCENLNTIIKEYNINVSRKTSLIEYIALIKSADIVIAVDGGSLHLACACEKPLLSFFANSRPNLDTWQPLVSPTVPHKRLISLHKENTYSNNTCNFDMNSGAEWLAQQIIKHLENK